VRSRILIGVGAWLLGAVSATAGSLYAVDQLGQSLLEQHTKEISVAMVNAELALENSGRHGPVAPSSPSPPVASKLTSAPHAAKPFPTGAPRPVTRDAGRLLTSAGGTAAASCAGGRAHLLYWSPGQGFAVARVKAGPSPVVSVSFASSSGGVMMLVKCNSSGVPVARVSTFGRGGGDEGQAG
jgi:hypothetical protein